MVIVGSGGGACHEMVTDVLLIKVTCRFVGGAGTGRAAWERMLAISYRRYFFAFAAVKFMMVSKILKDSCL